MLQEYQLQENNLCLKVLIQMQHMTTLSYWTSKRLWSEFNQRDSNLLIMGKVTFLAKGRKCQSTKSKILIHLCRSCAIKWNIFSYLQNWATTTLGNVLLNSRIKKHFNQPLKS